jgi:hypothetical protein
MMAGDFETAERDLFASYGVPYDAERCAELIRELT